MKNKLVVLTNLGNLRAYRVEYEAGESSPRLTQVEGLSLIDAHHKLGDRVSDQAGRFPSANGNGSGMSIGENHNLELENGRRLLKQMASSINDLVQRENPELWFLAAPQEINQRIVDGLDAGVRSRLTKNSHADLVKTPKADILGHF